MARPALCVTQPACVAAATKWSQARAGPPEMLHLRVSLFRTPRKALAVPGGGGVGRAGPPLSVGRDLYMPHLQALNHQGDSLG